MSVIHLCDTLAISLYVSIHLSAFGHGLEFQESILFKGLQVFLGDTEGKLLESVCTARYRGFESLSHRQIPLRILR